MINFDFSNVKIPLKIDSPIKDAVIEVHYTSTYPPETFYNFLDSEILQSSVLRQKGLVFNANGIERMPVTSLPQEIISANEFFKYQPLYRILSSDNKYGFLIGPNACQFEVHGIYTGWSDWGNFFAPILEILLEKNIISEITRISNRCVDEINDEFALQKLNFDLSLFGSQLADNYSFNTNFKVENGICILNIISKNKNTLLLDIDCINNVKISISDFRANFAKLIKSPHELNKKVFFSLIKKEYIDSNLNPEYK